MSFVHDPLLLGSLFITTTTEREERAELPTDRQTDDYLDSKLFRWRTARITHTIVSSFWRGQISKVCLSMSRTFWHDLLQFFY